MRVRNFVLSDALFAYKAAEILVRGLFSGNDGLQNVLAADDPDRLIVDFH